MGIFFSVLPRISPVIFSLSFLDVFFLNPIFLLLQGPQAFPLCITDIYYLIYHAPRTDIEIPVNCSPIFNLLPLICA